MRISMTHLALCMICAIALFMNIPVSAGQPGEPPGQNKLPAPEEVTCPFLNDPVFGGLTQVSADPVPGATGYQAVGTCDLGEGEELNSHAIGVSLPLTLLIPGLCDTFEVKLRALSGPQHPGGPLISGPKSKWSDVCEVPLPVE
jgi:hypothetical protein